MSPTPVTKIGNAEFKWSSRTYILGIINMSPESFGGDGLDSVETAVAQSKRFAGEGADILDIGGESTKPGYQPISAEEESISPVPLNRMAWQKARIKTLRFIICRLGEE